MNVTRSTAWLLDERYATVLRSMQDQPLVHVKDLAYAAPFATRIAWAAYAPGMTQRQLQAVSNIIAQRRWVEPPRWLSWAEVVQDRGTVLYRITVCPGTWVPEKLKQLAARRQLGCKARSLSARSMRAPATSTTHAWPLRRPRDAAANGVATSPSVAAWSNTHESAAC